VITVIAAQRLENQRITRPGRRQPADIVAWLGAVQAQEYPAAKWAGSRGTLPQALVAAGQIAIRGEPF
jgi:hypothetical protein